MRGIWYVLLIFAIGYLVGVQWPSVGRQALAKAA
jgi:hypothetical protein